MATRDISYYALYLERELRDAGDSRVTDREYIDGKADDAAAEFETQRLAGMTVDQAHECAMHLLLSDLNDNVN